METTGYEFDPFSELPPLPQEFNPMAYSRSLSSVITPIDSLAPLPHSDFTPFGCYIFSDHNHNYNDSSLSSEDAFFLDTSLSLLNHHHLSESTQLEQLFYEATHFDQLFHNEVATTPFLHLPDLNDVATTTTTPFPHLPDLKSFEQTTTVVEETTNKLFTSLAPPPKRHKNLGSSSSSTASRSPTAPHTIDGGVTKRKKISDKIRSLEKIMPWEKKMSLAMILEESHKYITFLQSQIASLRWMPLDSVYNTAGEVGEPDLLKSLTRQQILQVLANSPGSRNVLSTREVCVFSYEQLLSLKTMSRNL